MQFYHLLLSNILLSIINIITGIIFYFLLPVFYSILFYSILFYYYSIILLLSIQCVYVQRQR